MDKMIITKTPLRISFLGGNTDFPEYYTQWGGRVLTTAIDKYVYCIIKERFDDMIYINYSIKEKVARVEDIKHDLVREALKITKVTKGIEITFLSDIPSEGSGLGSSSAVVVGLLNALYGFTGRLVTVGHLAMKACDIEIGTLKKPIGVQDQVITACGGFRMLELGNITDPHNIASLKVEMDEEKKQKLNDSLMLFYTNRTRSSGDILKGMDIEKNIALLHENRKLAILGNHYLEKGKIFRIGELLDTYWQIKKKLNPKVTDPEIDEMYDKAKKAGAIGGKILGAGGGGFLLLQVPIVKQNKVRKALKGHKELKFRFEPYGSRVIFNI